MKRPGLVLLVGAGVAGLVWYALTHAPKGGALTQQLRDQLDEERQQAITQRRVDSLGRHLQGLMDGGRLPVTDAGELARRAIWSN